MQEKSEKITGIKEKLLYFIELQGVKKEDFYKKIDIDGANFRGKNKKSELSTDKIVKILRQYPELSPDWLLLDQGEMLRCDSTVGMNDSEIVNAYKMIIDAQRDTIIVLKEKVADLENRLDKYEGGNAHAVAG
ncbi:MAG: hypothetical protein J5708_05875 [Bacteroidales bacterium]|nr:hypothetical protein [Bacteroidales bacterium]